MLVLRREKTSVPGEKPLKARTRTNNKKLNPHMTQCPGIKPGPHWWDASALTPAPSLLYPSPLLHPSLCSWAGILITRLRPQRNDDSGDFDWKQKSHMKSLAHIHRTYFRDLKHLLDNLLMYNASYRSLSMKGFFRGLSRIIP